jgi:uncharacterized protein YggT (Ycf19 family)
VTDWDEMQVSAELLSYVIVIGTYMVWELVYCMDIISAFCSFDETPEVGYFIKKEVSFGSHFWRYKV